MTAARNGAEEAQRDTLLEEALTRKIIGCFFDVCRKLRPGFLEAVYKKALEIELKRAGCSFEREPPLSVFYDGERLSIYYPDFVVERRVVVEVKATNALGPADNDQLINALSCIDLEVGLLLQFGRSPKFKRVVFTNSNKTMLPSREHYPISR